MEWEEHRDGGGMTKGVGKPRGKRIKHEHEISDELSGKDFAMGDLICRPRIQREVWAAVFTFNPYLLISINEFLISIIHLLISINIDTASIFIDINN